MLLPVKQRLLNAINDKDTRIIVKKPTKDGNTQVYDLETKTITLGNVKDGEAVFVGDYEFIKLETFKNGKTLVAYNTEKLSRPELDSYPDKYVRIFLHDIMLPELEKDIGANNIFHHDTEYTTYTEGNERVGDKYFVFEKIGLLSVEEYMKYRQYLMSCGKFWLSNESEKYAGIVAIDIFGGRTVHFSDDVSCNVVARLMLNSSMIVKTRFLSEYTM